MTRTVDQDFETFNGNDAATAFSFSVIAQSIEHIYASHIAADGTITKLVQNTDFTVALNSNGTSVVTFPSGGAFSTLATGDDLQVRRIVPLTQTLALSQHGPYNPKAVENGLDKMMDALQQMSPDNPDAGGNMIYFDSDGHPQKGLEYSVVSGLAAGIVYGTTTFVTTLALMKALDSSTLSENDVLGVTDTTDGGIFIVRSGSPSANGNFVVLFDDGGNGLYADLLSKNVRAISGTIDGAVIGQTTPAAGSFTELEVANFLNFGAETELTIATGAVTATKSFHAIDTEGDASTDDLDTISGGSDGGTLVLKSADSSRDIVVKDGTGNLRLAGDFTLGTSQDTLTLMYFNSLWHEVSRSNNIPSTGTFVPVVADASSGGNESVTVLAGVYTRIADLVFVTITGNNVSTVGLTGGNVIFVTGLPFTANQEYVGEISAGQITYSGNEINPITITDMGVLKLLRGTSAGSLANLTVAALNSGVADIKLSMVYKTSA